MAIKIAVYIGRFQPFHNGHAHVLAQAFAENDYVIVLVGSSFQASTIKNPFDFNERSKMIWDWAHDMITERGDRGASFAVLPLVDYPYNNAKWIENVQESINKQITAWSTQSESKESIVTLYGSKRDDSSWYLDAFPQWNKKIIDAFPLNGNLTATSLRDLLFTSDVNDLAGDVPKTTMEFISGWMKPAENSEILARIMPAKQAHEYKNRVNPFTRLQDEYNFLTKYKRQFGRGEIDKLIAKYQSWNENALRDIEIPIEDVIADLCELRNSISPYPPVFVTVDVVVVQSGHLLVVERANLPGKGLWALPGGFLNPNERALDGAIRELIEETGIRLVEGKRSKEITEDILRNAVRKQQVFDHPDRSLRGRTITIAFYIRLDDTKPLPKVKGQNVPDYESDGQTIVETAWAKWIPINEARARTEKWFEDHNPIVDTFLG